MIDLRREMLDVRCEISALIGGVLAGLQGMLPYLK